MGGERWDTLQPDQAAARLRRYFPGAEAAGFGAAGSGGIGSACSSFGVSGSNTFTTFFTPLTLRATSPARVDSALGDAAHQVDDAALGDDLDRRRPAGRGASRNAALTLPVMIASFERVPIDAFGITASSLTTARTLAMPRNALATAALSASVGTSPVISITRL